MFTLQLQAAYTCYIHHIHCWGCVWGNDWQKMLSPVVFFSKSQNIHPLGHFFCSVNVTWCSFLLRFLNFIDCKVAGTTGSVTFHFLSSIKGTVLAIHAITTNTKYMRVRQNPFYNFNLKKKMNLPPEPDVPVYVVIHLVIFLLTVKFCPL